MPDNAFAAALSELPLAATTRAFLDGSPFGHVIDGHEIAASSGKTMAVIDPNTGLEFARCAEGNADDVDLACRTARRAFEDGRWRNLPAADKERILRRFAELIEANRDLLSDLDVIDGGVVRTYSTFLVNYAVNATYYYAGWPTKVHGTIPPVSPDFVIQQVREPVGVAAVIVPWNGPSVITASGIAALAAGNSVVLKPAENTPLTGVVAARIAKEAGIPDGVFNVVQGTGAVVGQALVEHPEVDVIAFTGSSGTGRRIQASSAARTKRVSMELGGKSPNIIFADAKLELAAAAAAGSMWGHAGQVCTAGSRVLVERKVHDEVVEKMIASGRSIRIGSGFNPETQMGPLISQVQLDRVQHYVNMGREQGAELVLGGDRHGNEGFFQEPTIFTGVNNDMVIAREEIFGPVMSVIAFDDFDEAMAIANDSEFGLASGVWTQDLDRAHRASQRLKAGTVWINSYQLGNPAVSYGGIKQSGHGRKLGQASLDTYTHTKSVWIKLS